MKYWEALIKGSKIRPQAYTQMFDGSGSCAIGAMYEAIFGTRALQLFNGADAWSLVNDINAKFGNTSCPVCKVTWLTGNVIWHLNDIHQWSRENIGYFLRTIEEPSYQRVEEKVNELVEA